MNQLSIGSWLCLFTVFASANSVPSDKTSVFDTEKIPTTEKLQSEPRNVVQVGTVSNTDSEADWNLNNLQYLNSDLNSEDVSYRNSDLNSDHRQYSDKVAKEQWKEPAAEMNTGPDLTLNNNTDAAVPDLVHVKGDMMNPNSPQPSGENDVINSAEVGKNASAIDHGPETSDMKAPINVDTKGTGSTAISNTNITANHANEQKANAPRADQESMFIGIETVEPDALRAGLIQQTEKTSAKHKYDKFGNLENTVHKLIHSIFQTFVHSKTDKGLTAIDKFDASVAIETSLGNKHKLEMVNEARDPFADQNRQTNKVNNSAANSYVDQETKITNSAKATDPADIGDKTQQNLNGFKQRENILSRIIKGPEARSRSKKIFGQIEKIGEQINNVLREFFPGLVNLKVSTGPKSNVAAQQQAVKDAKILTKPEYINTVESQPIDGVNAHPTSSDNMQDLRKFHGVESGIDSIVNRIKQFFPSPSMSKFNMANRGPVESRTGVNHRENLTGSLGKTVSGIFNNIFKAVMDSKDSFISQPTSNESVTLTDVPADTYQNPTASASIRTQEVWDSVANLAPAITKTISDSFQTKRNNLEISSGKTPASARQGIDEAKKGTLNNNSNPWGSFADLAPKISQIVGDSVKAFKENIAHGTGSMTAEPFGVGLDDSQRTRSSTGIDKSQVFKGPPIPTNGPYEKPMDKFRKTFGFIMNDLQRQLMGPYWDTLSKSLADSMQQITRDAVGSTRATGESTTKHLSPAVV